MLPSTYSLYPSYAASILARDFVLAFVFAATLAVFGYVAVFARFQPRVVYIARMVAVGGFYASMALAFIIIH